jgi:predicted NBD/HSP70 family sugar kinase
MLGQSGISQATLCGLGFAMAGFFVDGSRNFNAPEPLRDWSLVDLEPELADLFDVPIFLENSATAGAIGESLSGVGQRFETFAYLSFNYGFGGGIIIDGKPYLGRRGNAGEFSSLFTQEEGPRRPALQYLLRMLQNDGVSVSGIDELRRSFDPSWPSVHAWIEMVMPQMDRMVMALSGILDPEAIVFGGEIAPELARMLIARVTLSSGHRYGVAPPQPHLLLSETTGDPAATGAALLPLKYRFFR